MTTETKTKADERSTLGPFHVSERYDTNILDADGFIVASVDEEAVLENWESLGIRHWANDERASRHIPEPQAEEIARLFAAAPEFKAACETLVANEITLTGRFGRRVKRCNYCSLNGTHEPHCPVGMAVKALAKSKGGE